MHKMIAYLIKTILKVPKSRATMAKAIDICRSVHPSISKPFKQRG